MTSTGASGDLAADRRFQWATGALEAQDYEGARDIFVQTLELAPNWPPAWFGLGQALEAQGRREEAAQAFARALALDPFDAAGASLRLARLGGDSPAAAPRAYVETLFDQYAARFDKHLVGALAYRGPDVLAERIEHAAPGRIFSHILDLGCGSGLMGAAIRGKARRMTGVDLSPAMIEQAKGKRIYDRLATAELLDFLNSEPEASADLVVAADVFVYIGDLAPVLAAISRVLEPGGLLAFTAQQWSGESFQLGEDLRFSHGEPYLRARAAKTGFAIVELKPATTRKDRGADVPGWVAILLKN
jgi:predicted TPR repeat methyltransferase